MNRKPRILVVDDEPRNAKLLEALLIPKGYEVVVATQGEEALTAVAGQDIDLILLDVMMPGVDGFEVTRRLREHERTRLLPIVLITALKDTEDRIKGIEAGCDDFISKPFETSEVLARVNTLLKLSYYRSLLDEKEKFESLIDQIEDGIVVLDQRLRIARLNRRAASLLMIEPPTNTTDFLGHLNTRFRIHYEGDVGRDLASRAVAFDLERPETQTAQPLILATRSQVIRDPLGEISSIVLTVHDATEERKEESLKRDFLSLISHKLRTPVAVIDATASLLQEGLLDLLTDEQKQAVDTIVEKAQGLGRLIEKLLAFITIQDQSVSGSTELIALDEYLPTLLQPLAERVKGKKVELRIACSEQGITTRMHRLYLDLILDNLLENATKFNDKDLVKIAVSVTRSADQVEIAVADNGLGIPPEEHGKIFETFYQVERYFTGNVEGAGLGLALVKRLITGYGGTIRVHSQLGQGSTFTFTVPA